MEDKYLIMIETFKDKVKLKKHEKRVMLFAPSHKSTILKDNYWLEIDTSGGFPENNGNVFQTMKEYNDDPFPDEETYNSTYSFKVLTVQEVVSLMQEVVSKNETANGVDR